VSLPLLVFLNEMAGCGSRSQPSFCLFIRITNTQSQETKLDLPSRRDTWKFRAVN
jgi:hypothetical protein